MEKNHRLIDPKKGPGALVDIGIYPIFFSYLLLGEPKEIVAKAHYFNSKADIQISMIFQYENAQALMYSGIANNSDNGAKICGTKGEIYLNSRWHETDSFKLLNEMKEEIFEIPKKGRGYTHEIEEVNKCLKKNKIESPLWSHKNSYELSVLINKIRESSNKEKD
jgi:predicted dehydrogenase